MSEESKEEVVPPIKVDKWDGSAVKNALDDAIREVFVKKLGYFEDHTLVDRRLIISGFAVLVALYAIAYDFFYPFPKSKNSLIICVGIYFLTMAILSLYVTYIEKGIFVTVIQRDPLGYDADVIWESSSSMKNYDTLLFVRYDDMYSFTLVAKNTKTSQQNCATLEKSVANFFDEDGNLVKDKIERAVINLRNSLHPATKNK